MVGEGGVSGTFRRIEWHSAEAPGEIVTLLTDLPAERFDAPRVVALSCRRWRDALPLALEPVTGGARSAPCPAALLASGSPRLHTTRSA